MRPLLRLLLRGWLDRPGRTLLAAGGVGLGVAVLLAVRLANLAAIDTFGRALELVAGRTDIEVVSAAGGLLPPGTLLPFTRMPGVRAAAPVYTLQVRAGAEGRRVRILGVDLARDSAVRPWYRAELREGTDPIVLFSHPRGVLLTPFLADELRLAAGDRFPVEHGGRTDTLEVLGLLQGEEVSKARSADFLVMDLPRLWNLAGGPRGLDRIDLLLAKGVDPEKALAAVRTLLPPGARAEPAGWRRPQAKRMLAAFILNLTSLAFVALLVAGFLVFQTVSTGVLQRRRQAGILRSIGASRRFIRRLLLAEGAMLGVLGSLIGVLFGLLLARSATGAVRRTVHSLYLLEGSSELQVSTEAILTSAALGIVVSLLAVWPLAREAARVPPRESFSRQVLEDRLRPRLWALSGLISALIGTFLAVHPLPRWPVLSGYAAAVFWVLGAALSTPWGLGVLHRLLTAAGVRRLGATLKLALGVLVRSRHRVAPAVAALATAVAMWLSVDMMVQSFRGTVSTWVGSTIRADLIVTAGGSMQKGELELMPGEYFTRLQGAPGLADVDCFRSTRVELYGRPTVVAAAYMPSVRRQDRLHYLEKLPGEHPLDALVRGENGCVISEPLAFRTGLAPGDTLDLPTPGGREKLLVRAVFYDYSSDAGMVLLDRDWFIARWHDDRVESMAVYLPPGVDLAEGRGRIRAALPPGLNIDVFSNRELRNAVLTVFDHTFAITYALEAVAIIVALLAVGGGMAALVSERTRELAILRSMGASRRQILGRTLFEAGILGGAGWALGALLGIVLSLILTYVVNRYSFGWSLALRIPAGHILLSGALMVLAALSAGSVPALRASRVEITKGIRINDA